MRVLLERLEAQEGFTAGGAGAFTRYEAKALLLRDRRRRLPKEVTSCADCDVLRQSFKRRKDTRVVREDAGPLAERFDVKNAKAEDILAFALAAEEAVSKIVDSAQAVPKLGRKALEELETLIEIAREAMDEVRQYTGAR